MQSMAVDSNFALLLAQVPDSVETVTVDASWRLVGSAGGGEAAASGGAGGPSAEGVGSAAAQVAEDTVVLDDDDVSDEGSRVGAASATGGGSAPEENAIGAGSGQGFKSDESEDHGPPGLPAEDGHNSGGGAGGGDAQVTRNSCTRFTESAPLSAEIIVID